MLSHYRKATIPEDCPRIHAWCEAMAGRRSVRETMHDASWYVERYRKHAEAA